MALGWIYLKNLSAQEDFKYPSTYNWLILQCITDERLQKAIKYFELAKDQGALSALTSLGAIYLGILQVKARSAESDKILKKAKDVEKAIKYLKIAKDRGDCNARLFLSWCFADGIGVERDWEKAVAYNNAVQPVISKPYLPKLSDEFGIPFNREWLFHSGMTLLQGCCDVPKNMHEGFFMLRAAAYGGLVAAQYNLGVCYANGIIVEKNQQIAIHYYKLAVSNGCSAAMYALGLCYDRGEGIEQNITLAHKLYKRAAIKGHANALFKLGLYCESTLGGHNKRQAILFYMLSATRGNALAIYKVGRFHESGEKVNRNTKLAIHLYMLALELWDHLVSLDIWWHEKLDTPLSKESENAIAFFRGLQKTNFWSPPGALYERRIRVYGKKALRNYRHLADIWYTKTLYLMEQSFMIRLCGIASKKALGDKFFYTKRYCKIPRGIVYNFSEDDTKYVEYNSAIGSNREEEYDKVAELQLLTQAGAAKAPYELGVFYEYGVLVEMDMQKAIKHYKLSEERGNAYASYRLGLCYDKGKGVQSDKAKAVEHFKLASDRHLSCASYRLALYYEQKDEKMATRYYQLTIEQRIALQPFDINRCDFGRCLYKLGERYDGGIGVEQDREKAKDYFKLAAEEAML